MIEDVDNGILVAIGLTGAAIVLDFAHCHSWGRVFGHLGCIIAAFALAVPVFLFCGYSAYLSKKGLEFGEILGQADQKFSDNFSQIKSVERKLENVLENVEGLKVSIEKITEHIKKVSPEAAQKDVQKAVVETIMSGSA